MDDEEMVEFVKEAFEGEEIDMDYEFDAPRFYDFTTLETDWEAEVAEDWFRYAGSYPSSRKQFTELVKYLITFLEMELDDFESLAISYCLFLTKRK